MPENLLFRSRTRRNRHILDLKQERVLTLGCVNSGKLEAWNVDLETEITTR